MQLLNPSTWTYCVCVFLLTASSWADAPAKSLDPMAQWPQWRGPLGTGEAPQGNPPTVWSEDENVRWKLDLPGLGHGTPIIWGDLLVVTSAERVQGDPTVRPVPTTGRDDHSHGDHDHSEHEPDHGAHDNMAADGVMAFLALGVDRHTGDVRWRRELKRERPHEGTHQTGSWASASPATDGQRLIVSFGSRGLFGLDLDGNVRWDKDLGNMTSRHEHGEGSSPALHGGTVVVNWDHQGDSFIVALDADTGEERWRQSRDEITSWSTPLIVEQGGKAQAIVSATGRTRGYDLATGKVLWQTAGLSRNVVASPVAADGRVIVANSYDFRAMLAIDLAKAKGDITGTDAVLWTLDRHTPYVPSPVLVGDTVYFLTHLQGILTGVDTATGARRFGPARLRGLDMIFASPVAAAGRLYIPGRSGATLVLELGDEPKALGLNPLDDIFSASPAVVGDVLYLRGETRLYAIAETTTGPAG